MENQEKTEVEVKERKGWMGPGTKTALIAAGLSLVSVVCLYLIAYSNQITESGGISGGIVGSIVGGILGGIVGGSIFGGIVGGISGGILGGIVGGISGGISGGIVGGIFGGGIWKKEINVWVVTLLCIVFLLPLCTAIVPLSRYHNQNQLKRDQKIVEMLELTVLEDRLMVLLPDKCVGENSYLKKVFSLGWAEEINKKRWKEIAIPCRKGDSYWYEAKLPFSEKRSEKKPEAARLELRFDHAWEDLIVTKEVSLK